MKQTLHEKIDAMCQQWIEETVAKGKLQLHDAADLLSVVEKQCAMCAAEYEHNQRIQDYIEEQYAKLQRLLVSKRA